MLLPRAGREAGVASRPKTPYSASVQNETCPGYCVLVDVSDVLPGTNVDGSDKAGMLRVFQFLESVSTKFVSLGNNGQQRRCRCHTGRGGKVREQFVKNGQFYAQSFAPNFVPGWSELLVPGFLGATFKPDCLAAV